MISRSINTLAPSIKSYYDIAMHVISTPNISYKATCYSGVDAFKMMHDVSRIDIPYQYCIGKNGFDKKMSLDEVIEKIAKPKNAHVIVKSGPNAKWYVKNICPVYAHDILNCGKEYCTIKNEKSKCYVIEW